MGTSRRDFLKKGSLLALATGVPVSLATTAFGGELNVSSQSMRLTRDAFQAQLNTTFLIKNGDSPTFVRLIDVADLPRRGSTSRQEAFSLLFRGDDTDALQQDTYLFEHDKLGLFSFLIVPVGRPKKNATCYEAIINHRQA